MASTALRAGRYVVLANSRGPGTLDSVIASLPDGASAGTVEQAAGARVERGFAIPTEDLFRGETGPRGALYVGSPETVAEKIAANLRALSANLFELKYGMPGLTHESLMRNIELHGQRVVPRVRELLA
jgi:alkanesulfonate monooxygenase SsuD/methylene tetrahydromethanopterin reductase-like flavin-dependent oxidoreductase (luciferase family)